MIHLYDGNNVMLRAFEGTQMGGQRPIGLRMRYERTCIEPPGTQIWCWDGRQHNERRQEIYPPYKTNRPPMAEDRFAQIGLWKDLLKLSPATQINVHGWEADDIIGTLVRRLSRTGTLCTVHTNDMDYGQLLHLGNVTLNGVDMKGIEARWIPLYKAMVGDKSDRIAGIPGFGDGMWSKMAEHWPQIERAIVAGTPAGFQGLPFTRGVKAWLSDQSNIDLLQAMLTVTHLQDVPDDELEGGIIEGTMDREQAHSILKEFFL